MFCIIVRDATREIGRINVLKDCVRRRSLKSADAVLYRQTSALRVHGNGRWRLSKVVAEQSSIVPWL